MTIIDRIVDSLFVFSFTGALVTLEVPPIVCESELEFTASVILVRPAVSQTTLEINIMDTGITARSPG